MLLSIDSGPNSFYSLRSKARFFWKRLSDLWDQALTTRSDVNLNVQTPTTSCSCRGSSTFPQGRRCSRRLNRGVCVWKYRWCGCFPLVSRLPRACTGQLFPDRPGWAITLLTAGGADAEQLRGRDIELCIRCFPCLEDAPHSLLKVPYVCSLTLCCVQSWWSSCDSNSWWYLESSRRRTQLRAAEARRCGRIDGRFFRCSD